MTDFLNEVGITEVARDSLKMEVNKPASWSAHDLRTRPVIPSGPAAFLMFTLLNSLRTSSSDTVITWSTSLLCLLLPDALIGGRGSGSSEFAEEVETLLCFLGQCRSVVSPGEVLCDVHTQELGAARSLHSHTVDGQRSMLSVHSPEVNNNLLRLLHIQREIVVPAPPGQAAHLAPVVCLVSVANETHHSRVIRKLNEKVRVVWRCAVVGQQSEEEGAQHTSLGDPCVQCDGAGCVNADPYCLRSPGQEVQQPVAQRGVEPQLDQFVSELLRDDCVECWTEVYEQHPDIWSLFCPDVWGLGGGQWRWHHRSSGWIYMQTGRGPGRGGGGTWCVAWLAVQSTSWE